jgi:hypothetical protein
MKKFSEFTKRLAESTKITNVNIGIDKSSKRASSIIKKIEAELDKMGIYYDSEGSDETTYNINSGFSDRKQAEKFEKKWGKHVDYIELETISM